MQVTSETNYTKRVVFEPLETKKSLTYPLIADKLISSRIHSVIDALPLPYAFDSKNLETVTKVIEASLKEHPESPAFIIKKQSLESLKNNVIINPKRGEAFICLEINDADKKGGYKQGSQAIRVTAKKAHIVWQLTSLKKHDVPLENTPQEFLLRRQSEPVLCPKPYGRFPELIETKKAIHNQETSFYEYYPHSLSDLHLQKPREIASEKSLSTTQVLLILHSLIKSLVILHGDKALAHGDIKRHNILIKGDKTSAVFCDFDKVGGTSRFTRAYGTYCYSAPEYLPVKRNSESGTVDRAKADIYALGVTFLTVINGKPPEWCRKVQTVFTTTNTRHKKNTARSAEELQFGLEEMSNKAITCLSKNPRLLPFLNHLTYSMLHPIAEKRLSAKELDTFITKYTSENKLS